MVPIGRAASDPPLDLDPVAAAQTLPEGAERTFSPQAPVVETPLAAAVGASHQATSGETGVDLVRSGAGSPRRAAFRGRHRAVARGEVMSPAGQATQVPVGSSARHGIGVSSVVDLSTVSSAARWDGVKGPAGIRKDARSEATSALDSVGRGARSKVRADDPRCRCPVRPCGDTAKWGDAPAPNAIAVRRNPIGVPLDRGPTDKCVEVDRASGAGC